MGTGLLRILPVISLAVALAGCELLPTAEEGAPERPPRADIAAYALTGRLAAHHDARSHHVGVDWRHTPDADRILLSGPLGQGIAELTRDARGALLVTADRQSVAAANWEALSQRIFGFALPLSGLPRWLLGNVRAATRDALGRPLTAQADGWEIAYRAYESDLAQALPVLIEFRRGDTDVRLKVDAWQID